jgi:hypothetical protein
MSNLPFKQIWHKRLGEDFLDSVDPFRDITHDNVLYLLDKYPYLQIINSDADFEAEEVTLKFLKAKSGWTIFDYGDAICASAGENSHWRANPEEFLRTLLAKYRQQLKAQKGEEAEDDEGADAPIITTGTGTLRKQMVDTAEEMILLALKKHWPSVSIIDGTHLMQWAAWMAAKEHKLTLKGFSPGREDEEKRERVWTAFGKAALEEEEITKPI